MAKKTGPKYDASGKRTIHHYALAWAEWILKNKQIEVEAELSGEFQIVTRDSDVLLKVRDKDGNPFLSLTELQTKYQDVMPRRLAAYAALAREKYKLDVYVAVVYFLPPPEDKTIEQEFHAEFMGQTAHQDIVPICLWELDAEDVLALENPALLPFIPLMKGGTKPKV